MILNIKRYIFDLLPSKLVLPKLDVTLVAIDHQMLVIQVQVRKNFIENVLLNGGFGDNINTKKLKV
jgi:hypothetical protein